MTIEIGTRILASVREVAHGHIRPQLRKLVEHYLWFHIHAVLVESVDIPVAEQLGNHVYEQSREPI
jgi:hypothetical protein